MEEGDPSGTLKNEADAALLRNVPPHSPDSEQAVLGSILLDSRSFLEIAPLLRAEDFYLPAHSLIYAACAALADQKNAPVDIVSVKNYLQEYGFLDKAGGAFYLTSLVETAVSSFRGEYHAGIVRDKARIRALINACAEIIQESFKPGISVSDLLDGSEQKILTVGDRRTDQSYQSIKEISKRILNEMTDRASSENPLTGLDTGYRKLNEITGGLQPSNLIIIAARPGMGKTALGLNLAAKVAVGDGRHSTGAPVAFFSLEMSLVELTQRLLCSEGGVDLSILRQARKCHANDWENLRWAADRLSKTKIFIDDTPALSIDALRSRARRLRHREGIQLVVVDYLQLMLASHQSYSREQEIAEISRGLKALAKELQIPVVALAQLNREVEKRAAVAKDPEKTRPQLSDLRESGAIEQDADLILMISNHSGSVEEPHKPRTVPIVIAKHRNGSTGEIYLQYLPPFTRFNDASAFEASGKRTKKSTGLKGGFDEPDHDDSPSEE